MFGDITVMNVNLNGNVQKMLLLCKVVWVYIPVYLTLETTTLTNVKLKLGTQLLMKMQETGRVIWNPMFLARLYRLGWLT